MFRANFPTLLDINALSIPPENSLGQALTQFRVWVQINVITFQLMMNDSDEFLSSMSM